MFFDIIISINSVNQVVNLSSLPSPCVMRSAFGECSSSWRTSPFDDGKMMQIFRNKLSSRINDPQGMLSVDSTEFVKKGKHSVGVTRQHCGRLGKTENCQSVVFVGYASDQGYGLVGNRLFMPKKWFSEEYESLRKKCCVPDDVIFKTKRK